MSVLIEQRRARFALHGVAQHGIDDKLEAAANGLPALILMNGLGQAAAYCKSRKEEQKQYKALYGAMSDWLCGQGAGSVRNPHPVYTGHMDLLAALTAGTMAEYRAAQAEALAFLQWLKSAVRAQMAGA